MEMEPIQTSYEIPVSAKNSAVLPKLYNREIGAVVPFSIENSIFLQTGNDLSSLRSR